MRQRIFVFVTPKDRKNASCRCGVRDPEAPDDAELEQLFHELALTLFQIMDPDDADMITRSELLGKSLSQISAETGCTRSEAKRRLSHAQRCFCELVALTLSPAKSE
jgi:DNA-directed RNA polymerase specialized sigma24 family protein